MGSGEFLDENTHANVIADSTTPSVFVGNILIAVFTTEILLVSTVTGRGSNRTSKKKDKKNELDDEDQKEKLNACKGKDKRGFFAS